MFADQTRTVLILPQALLDRARVFAGEATSQLKRMVSLQMVLRALIDEGLKQDGGRAVLANVEGQALMKEEDPVPLLRRFLSR